MRTYWYDSIPTGPLRVDATDEWLLQIFLDYALFMQTYARRPSLPICDTAVLTDSFEGL